MRRMFSSSSHTIHDALAPVVRSKTAVFRVKRAFDVVFALLVTSILFPVLILLILVLFVTQGRPIIFRHERIGLGGRRFFCLKFRTMVVDAEEGLESFLRSDPKAAVDWQTHHKLAVDPRVTPVGNVLRRTSLDELPQLWNVILGDMSIIGPRPIVHSEIKKYGRDFAFYKAVKPGITGLWQVSGRSDCSYPQRVRLDRDYVVNWNLGRDFAILLRTIPAVVLQKGSR
jgi:exopolysaccharide production protein ExoY